MISTLLVLILLLVAAESTFPYPPFSGINHYSRIEKSNEVIGCEMEDILNAIGLEELQHLIEALAGRKGVSPLLVLRKLLRRMRNKEEIEEAVINTVDGPEVLNQPIIDFPSVIKLTPETSHAPYSLSPNVLMNDDNDETKVVILPIAQSSLSKSPVINKPENKPRKETSLNSVSPLVGKLSNMLPEVFTSPVKNNQLRPPLGATVRVNSGDPLSPLSRDIIVTISPLMTLIEVLREAEIKYQNILGLNHETDVITFGHSAAGDCYIVNSINNVPQNEDFGWKVTIIDKDRELVYDSFCLPSSKDISVKPGTLICLAYIPF